MKEKKIISIYNKMGYQLLPNIGFTNITNFKSKICNTDDIGLRFNNRKEEYNSIFDENNLENKKDEVVLVGSSSAMGMAASNDQNTISSILSNSSEYHVYNFAVRAYNGFQEILITQALVNNLSKLKKIIIMSGINDLFLFLDPNFKVNFPGPQIYGNKLFSIRKEHLRFYKRLMFNLENKKKREINKSINLEEVFNRNLRLWSIFSKGLNIEVIYFMQPFLTWCKNISNDELENMQYGKSSVMKKLDNSYTLLKKTIYNSCLKNKIKFFDLNEIDFGDSDIFVDRVHLNDNGFRKISNVIKNYL